MSKSDWLRFYHAVDELLPDLMERLAHHLGKFTEQQQQVCYLPSIGLTNTQIENLTDIPHVTVWRWVKKMEWVQGDKWNSREAGRFDLSRTSPRAPCSTPAGNRRSRFANRRTPEPAPPCRCWIACSLSYSSIIWFVGIKVVIFQHKSFLFVIPQPYFRLNLLKLRAKRWFYASVSRKSSTFAKEIM